MEEHTGLGGAGGVRPRPPGRSDPERAAVPDGGAVGHGAGRRLSAEDVAALVAGAPDRTVPVLRKVRRRLSRRLADAPAARVLDLGREILAAGEVPRWLVYELVHHHRGAFSSLDAGRLEALGRGMASWGEVDPFGVYLAGPAWREGLVGDEVILGWAGSPDRWWRRAALVSTVALNSRARGGDGDPRRTLAVCDRLRADRDDMVVKAMSWALRELCRREPPTVARYLDTHREDLAPRVLREVRNKLETGLKNPGRRSGSPDRR